MFIVVGLLVWLGSSWSVALMAGWLDGSLASFQFGLLVWCLDSLVGLVSWFMLGWSLGGLAGWLAGRVLGWWAGRLAVLMAWLVD